MPLALLTSGLAGPALARALLAEVVVPQLLVGPGTTTGGEATDSGTNPTLRSGTLFLSEAAAPATSSRRGSAPESRFASPRHAHGAHEVCWVVDGRCVLAIGQGQLVLDTGDVCIVRPGEAHQLRPTTALEPFQTLWWHVTAGGVNLPLASFSDQRQVTRGGFVALDPSPVPTIAAVVHELETRQPQYDLIARAGLLDLAARILRAQEQTATTAPAPLASGEVNASWHVQRVAEYIDTHHDSNVTLASLAAYAGVSPYYLTTLFRRYTGRSVMAYLGDVRHREARSLLRNTDLAIAEVARTVGYDDPYYFSRVFKAREGCPPSAYRAAFQPRAAATR